MPEDVTRRLGYRLKGAAAALRGAMDKALRTHGLTVPQYACLELLDQQPGLSNADLARGTFVTRQSMNVVLRGLEGEGLITRPATSDHGRALPARLTDAGQHRLDQARSAVYSIDQRLTEAIPEHRRAQFLDDLDRAAAAVAESQR
ncbi:MarR family winged helix-turn-helix transcriptional regulator [Amycolatopsis magusensis]|uniref:MarR family winged helix-turn-helix transcriptional regulator n=1 Tax=Amycolatopsis magusensis TaxID=882444 RepID=UPI0037B32083